MAYLKNSKLKKLFRNKTVSVVGNASSLFDSEYGDLIDSSDIVCRFNLGPHVNSPLSHGTRTDWCIYNNYRWAEENNLFNIENDWNYIEVNFDIENKIAVKVFPLPVQSKLDLLEKLVLDGSDKPSIGVYFLHFLTQCKPKQVNIFGFDWKHTHTWYNKGRKRKKDERKKGHNWDKELDYFQKFIEPLSQYQLYNPDK